MSVTHIKSLRAIAVALALTTFPVIAVSQSYNSLWKKVDKACSQGLPKTALRYLDDIVNLPQHDNAQQLKALVTRLTIANDISEDSAMAMLPKIESVAQSQTSDTDASLWNMVLGWLYAQHNTRIYPQSTTKAIEAFSKATTHTEPLATTSSSRYLPIIHKGDDSHYYGHDMLSIVFPFTAQQLHNMHTPAADSLCRTIMSREIDYYISVGNRPATLLAKLDSTEITDCGGKEVYKQLIDEFQDCPLVSEVYVRLASISADSDAYALVNTALEKYPSASAANKLRNTLTNITLPSLQCSAGQDLAYPGRETMFSITHRNTASATIAVTRLPYNATDSKLNELTENDYAKLSQKPDFSTSLTFARKQPYEYATDTARIRFPKSGIYLIKLQSPDTDDAYQIMHVSALSVIQLPLPGRKTRICIADNANGKPVANAKIRIKSSIKDTPSWQDYVCDDKGELTIDSPKSYSEIFASTDGDEALPAKRLVMSYDYKWNFSDNSTRAKIYTDRSIYRPGQTVKAGGFVYQQSGDSTSVKSGIALNVELYNANNKLTESVKVTTDELGAFGAEFTLPKECLNGTFRIACDYTSTSFRVEEYKRPTFTVDINQPAGAYAPGDTIHISGDVTTVAGRPMGNTTVYCRTVCNKSRWLRLAGGGDSPTTRLDTIVTDGEGKFVLPVVLMRFNVNDSEPAPMFYTYTINVKATADDGETQENTLRIFAGDTKVTVSANVPDVICKEQLPPIVATQCNAMGNAVDGKGLATITQGCDTLHSVSLDFNKAGQLDIIKTLPSGEYTLTIMPEGETDRRVSYSKTFTLLSLNDTKMSGNAPLQVWSSGSTFADNKQPVRVIVGSTLADTWLRYDIMANGKVIDSQLIHLNDTVLHFDYTYSEDYGYGVHAQFALLHNGKFYRKSVIITKPKPDKSLNIKWSTFRNKLTPGAEETWVMHVTKDSMPVKASILATMYDASLNKFGTHSLPFSLYYNRTVPGLYWSNGYQSAFSLSADKTPKMLTEHELDFSIPDPTLFNLYRTYGLSLRSPNHRFAKSAMINSFVALNSDQAEASVPLEGRIGASNAPTAEDALFDQVKLRTDFSETAFFAPSLKTDSQGNARIEFKLPESITSWNFRALAHTAQLDFATVDTTITVVKPFAVYANVPRFVRNSDKTVLTTNITNNTSTNQSGKLRLTLTNAQTGKQVTQSTLPFTVGPNQNTTVGFDITVPDDVELMICHVAAVSCDFSDAEQQYIPVLPDTHRQISTVPFTVSDSASHTISLAGLNYNPEAKNAKLTFEYTANPIWTLLTAMPTTLSHTTPCATTLAANYASLATVRTVLNRYPRIRPFVSSWLSTNALSNSPLAALENNAQLKDIILSESPWEGDAIQERQRLSGLAQSDAEINLKLASMLDKLKELQTADGGWQWFPGMSSNLSLTLQITETLLRQGTADNGYSDKVTPMTDKAIRYLERKMKDMVTKLKDNGVKELPATCIEYLHVMVMANRTDNAECKYLLRHLKKYSADYNIYHKALAASVLQSTGHDKEAQALVRSLMEHTVYTQSTGRYFDSHKAPSSWSMYRIPTQLRTIETLQQVCPDSTTAISQMKQWLLMGKHTQAWTSPLTAAQAIQELASTWSLDSALTLPSTITLTTDRGNSINLLDSIANNTLAPLGYIKTTLAMDKANGKPMTLQIGATGNTLSYGAVYLASRLSSSQTKPTSSGIALALTLYKETATGWTAITPRTTLHKGDRIKAHYTVQTSRDLDFVSIKTPHAACMEPITTASGYCNGYYASIEDASTTYFYDKVAKGTLALEETYTIDRQGTFCIAPAEAQCQYAPEFIATTQATTLHVK